MDDTWDTIKMVGLFVILGLVVIGIFAIMIIMVENSTMISNPIRAVIEGEVIDYEVYDDYINITFSNNKSYEIRYKGDMDFTVNSKLVVKLHRYDYDGWFIKSSDYWMVDSITKLPEKLYLKEENEIGRME